jgi:hypothetical protein
MELNTSWGPLVRDAVQDCLSAWSSNRPSTDLLLQILKEDAFNDDNDPEPLDAIADSTLPRSVADERSQAVAALREYLQALSEDCGFFKAD